MVIGVFGDNPFGDELEDVVKGRRINGHPIIVKSFSSAAAVRNVHLLFIAAAAEDRLGEFRAAVRGTSILTVGETDEFFRRGGIIQFVVEGDKIRFDINAAQASSAGLKISAQLLSLARARASRP
jgi:hypothetical protein